MERDVKIPFAWRESDGAFVHVREVSSGLNPECKCILCKSMLVAKKGQKTTAHFAHHAKSACKPETVLHRLGKEFLAQRIRRHIESKIPLKSRWVCSKCGSEHNGDLIKRACRVILEESMGVCRPDLALFDQHGVFAVIEVIVSHAPESDTIAEYQRKGIYLMRYVLESGNALELIQNCTELKFAEGDYCTRRKCRRCQNRMQERKLVLLNEICQVCKLPLRLAMILEEGTPIPVHKFWRHEVRAAVEKGAVLEHRQNPTRTRHYLANRCGGCGWFVGARFITDLAFNCCKSVGNETWLVSYSCRKCGQVEPAV